MSFAQEIGGEMTDGGEGAYAYEQVVDDTNSILIEVPTEWSDRVTEPWDVTGGQPFIQAAASIEGLDTMVPMLDVILGDAADHRPHERAVALGADPRVVVVGDGQEVEPDLLGSCRVGHEVTGRVLLAGERVTERHHGVGSFDVEDKMALRGSARRRRHKGEFRGGRRRRRLAEGGHGDDYPTRDATTRSAAPTLTTVEPDHGSGDMCSR